MAQEVTIYVDYYGAKCNSLRRYEYGEETYLEVRNALTASETLIEMSDPTVGQRSDSFLVYRATLQFNTSVIPENVQILNAKLQIQLTWDASDTDFDIVIQNGQPDYPHDPAVVGDYYYEHYSGNGGSINTFGKVLGAYYDIIISAEGKAWINKGSGAVTKICLRSSREIAAIEPSDGWDERVSIDTTKAGRAKLWVEYTPINTKDTSGKAAINTDVEIILYKDPKLINIKATKLAGHLTLYGEMDEAVSGQVTERGFEYKIQDEEPIEEDTGTEVKETKEEGFDNEEYHLSSWDTYNDLYRAEEDKIWWFRAYCKDIFNNKFIADSWMKNVPTMTTSECTDTTPFSTKGHGELIDIGANIVTERGFHIIKEFSGTLAELHKYTLFHGFRAIDVISTPQFAPNGMITGFLLTGELLRVVSTKYKYGYDLEEYELDIGTGLFDALLPNDTYKVKAFGKNQLGRGFGEGVAINTVQTLYEIEPPVISPTSVEKTVTIDNIPEGAVATRVGIRLGRTRSCNEIDVYMDGEWGNGDKVNFFITDLVPGEKYYEMPYMVLHYTSDEEGEEWVEGNLDEVGDIVKGTDDQLYECIQAHQKTEDNHPVTGDDWPDYWIPWEPPECEDPIDGFPDYGDPDEWPEWDDEFPPIELPEWPDFPDIEFPLPDLVGIDYATIIKEIKCSIIADQSIIDKYGRRRTLTIKNNLIQTLDFCISIRDDYLTRFQELKLKIDIDYDIPLPFEREDTILLAHGQINYKTDGNGVIGAKADGEGVVNGKMSILTKIRKININAKTEEAILTLELEV